MGPHVRHVLYKLVIQNNQSVRTEFNMMTFKFNRSNMSYISIRTTKTSDGFNVNLTCTNT